MISLRFFRLQTTAALPLSAVATDEDKRTGTRRLHQSHTLCDHRSIVTSLFEADLEFQVTFGAKDIAAAGKTVNDGIQLEWS